jgi:hypothetical protein
MWHKNDSSQIGLIEQRSTIFADTVNFTAFALNTDARGLIAFGANDHNV